LSNPCTESTALRSAAIVQQLHRTPSGEG